MLVVPLAIEMAQVQYVSIHEDDGRLCYTVCKDKRRPHYTVSVRMMEGCTTPYTICKNDKRCHIMCARTMNGTRTGKIRITSVYPSDSEGKVIENLLG